MSEEQLNNKRYYEQFLSENEVAHPIRVLGEAFMTEQKNEIPDLNAIRFAQGELYYHHKDLETAIFKWENIHNELEPWAKKNMADAYYELELHKTAEDIYKAIISDSVILNTEIGLQLFSLYIVQNHLDAAFKVIKKVVDLNPDYPNVTEIARDFFEEQKDWKSAVELVASEAKRTGYLHWFDFLNDYVKNGYTKEIEPLFFIDVLSSLYEVDTNRFQELIMNLMNSYKKDPAIYYLWVQTMNELFTNLEPKSLKPLEPLFKDSYFQLMKGQYFIRELKEIIPAFLSNWIQFTGSAVASAAILAWNEIFPASLNAAALNEAENRVYQTQRENVSLDEVIQLFDAILEWADGVDIQIGHRIKWVINELVDFKKHHLLVAEMNGNGKSAFINFILEDNVSRAQTSTAVMYKYKRDIEMNEMTDANIRSIEDITDFHSRSTIHRQTKEGRAVIECKYPCPFLFKNKLAIIDTPGFSGNHFNREEVMHYLHAADSMFFLLNGHAPLMEKEIEILLKIREQMPDLNIHFILKLDKLQNETSLVNETKLKVKAYFPNAEVLPFSTERNQAEQERDLQIFIETYVSHAPNEINRTEKCLYFIRHAITNLLEKRVEAENNLVNSIAFKDQMLAKLNGAIHQLGDMEHDKIREIQKLFVNQKEELKEELHANIPQIIRSCSDIITEESDYGKLHVLLNDEMNKRIEDYFKNNVLPTVYHSLKDWIVYSEEELNESQTFLNEMSEGFNRLFNEERMELACDFKLLDDWRRDADRLTSGVTIDKVNILLKFTPAQLLLKGAGKLLSTLQQNKSILYHKYKNFVENEDYEDVTNSIITKFMMQFDLFEKSLERDLKIFFKNPFSILQETYDETENQKMLHEESLTKMRENPERFHDPLALFELQLRQYEWMMVASNNPSFTYSEK
ncbi:dynamin family protein [Neobacillus sp. D3-1R]|uniref:dynamin family protein n=1 Tax=Neobacillus sp. D3-1R TaxID=3445778 RepID=UPI003FA16EE7